MADADFYTISKPQNPPPQVPLNPTKFYTQFIYKAIMVLVFLLLLPFLPSQAPDFFNQTLTTRSWELLQLLFVGISVSYGLFSKRNDETEKEHGSKFENAQSYVAGLLQVTSVFDDESDNSPVSDDNNKVQTWNSQYYRGEPMVVVAQENSVLEEHISSCRGSTVISGSQTIGKPMLSPVRSLRNGVSEQGGADANSVSRTSSRPNSKRVLGISRNGDSWGASPEDLEDDVVFQSPIPWRSRSGRMEVKEEDLDCAPLYTLPQSPKDSARYQHWKPSSKNMSTCSASSTSELQAKSVEDVVKKKPSHKSSFQSIPPPPPPPPLPHKTPSANYTRTRNNAFGGKELRRSITSFAAARNETEDFLDLGFNRSASTLMGKSVRTVAGKCLREEEEDDKYEMRVNGFDRNMGEGRGHTNTKQTYEECAEKVVTETEDESEESEDDEDDRFEELPEKDGKAFKDVCSSDTGPDVDKKADEFIAKFREQIRLQRIASIRRSTGQIPKTSVR